MSGTKLSSRATTTTSIKTSHENLNKEETKLQTSQRRSSTEEHGNITIRLSDLGIIKRSPSELELQIQSSRILHILDKTTEKLQIAVCLPRLLRRNACILRRHLSSQEVEFIQSVCWKYSDTPPASHSHVKKCSLIQTLSTVIDKISMHETKKKMTERLSYIGREQDHLVDPHMAQVMEMLWNTRTLREKVLQEFYLLKESPSTTLVNYIKSLKEAAEHRLSMTAIEEKARERRLRKAWTANSIAEENIEKIKLQLAKQRADLGNQLKIKNEIVTDYTDRIEKLKFKFKDDVKHKIQESEKDMAEETHGSELRQEDLAVEAKTITQQFESLLSQHLAQEKGLRAKRFKVETQLSSWLAKYDADIGERQAEFEEITKGYEEEKAEMEALQEKFDEQEEEYVVLMAEKEEEEQRIWEERAYEFLLNRSARKIQRCWKAYRQRKIDRRKAKKAKKNAKKQKSAEAAEGGGTAEPPSEGKKGGKDKKGKGKGKDKGKKEQSEPTEFRGPDPMAALENKFSGGVMEDLKGEGFSKAEVVVDLSAEPAGVSDVKVE